MPGIDRLFVANLDPEQAAVAFKERAVGPYRGILPEAAITSMEEQLSGACTVEIAAFNEFTAVLASPQETAGFDHVIFDTAPTGHTLRLLTLPSAWSGYVDEHPSGASCLGPLAGLDQRREQYAATVRILSDPALTTLVLVSRAEESALREAARASGELAALGVGNQRLVINGLLSEHDEDPAALAFAQRQAFSLAGAPAQLAGFPAAGVRLIAGDLTGLDALRQLAGDGSIVLADSPRADDPDLPRLDELVDELDAAGHGVVMTMGKGGVGKTTLAAALAIALAERGHDVTLSTTDPAAHIADALADASHEALLVERIDPAVETARYTEEVMNTAVGLAEEGRTLLEEDLRSPCTEEIAVFRAFARTVDAARERIVVLDTAPTGHTLLLLDAAQSYQREVRRTNADVPTEVSELPRAPARPRVRADARRHARRVHAGAGGRAAPGRPAPRRHRALRLGHQRLPVRRPNRMRDAACACAVRARAHRARRAAVRPDVARCLAGRTAGRARRSARAERRPGGGVMATALFVCLHNAGRSQMSAALLERAAQGRHLALSAGSEADPNGQVHPQVVEVMREIGIDLSDRRPQRLTQELAEQADVVVTMGCGDACPFIPRNGTSTGSFQTRRGVPSRRSG